MDQRSRGNRRLPSPGEVLHSSMNNRTVKRLPPVEKKDTRTLSDVVRPGSTEPKGEPATRQGPPTSPPSRPQSGTGGPPKAPRTARNPSTPSPPRGGAKVGSGRPVGRSDDPQARGSGKRGVRSAPPSTPPKSSRGASGDVKSSVPKTPPPSKPAPSKSAAPKTPPPSKPAPSKTKTVKDLETSTAVKTTESAPQSNEAKPSVTEEKSSASSGQGTTVMKTEDPEADERKKGVKRKPKHKGERRIFRSVMSGWFVVLVVGLSVVGSYGYKTYTDIEQNKVSDQAYQRGAEDAVSQPGISSVLKIGNDQIAQMVTSAPGASFPAHAQITSARLDGWSTPGGTVSKGEAAISMCYTGDGVKTPLRAKAYLVSENAGAESPAWNVDSVSVTGDKCLPKKGN